MNQKKKKIFLMSFLVLLTSVCFGQQISFQIVQHNNSVEEVTEEALVVEDALISSFFDQGYIVTNSLASLSKNVAGDKKLMKTGLTEAVDGLSDYFVQIILHFTEKKVPEGLKKTMILEKVDYSVTTVKDLDVKDKGNWKCEIEIVDSTKDMDVVSASLIKVINKAINA